MYLFEKLKLNPTNLDISYEKSAMRKAEKPTPVMLECTLDSVKSTVVVNAYLAALLSYLAGNTKASLGYFVKCASYVDDYFWGSWRTTYQVQKSQGNVDYWKYLSWMLELEVGILSCAISGNWDLAKRLAAYPDDLVGPDVDVKAEYFSILMATAEWFHVGSLSDKGHSHLTTALSGKYNRSRLEAEMLKAAISEDVSVAKGAFEEYMKFYVKKIFPTKDRTDWQSRAGTIYWHWWQRVGVDLDVDGKYRDYIIRFS